MKLNKVSKIFFSLICILIVSSIAYAQMVTVVGMGDSRTMALEMAKRAAVEQGVGALIDSKTKMENFKVIEEKIYSRASGYVTSYNILSEGKAPDGTYTVTIQANVQTASIKNDLRAIGILMVQIGNPRFMAVYMPQTKSSTEKSSRVVKSAEQAINGVFARKGFIVIDRMFVNNVYNQIERAGRIDIDMDDLAALALKYRADLLLVYDVHAAKKVGGQSRYFGGVLVEMSLKAVSTSTADLIGEKSGDLYVKTQKNIKGNYYNNMQASKASDKLGKAIAEGLIEKDVLPYYERASTAGNRFDVWLRNFSQRETYKIVDVIEAMHGFRDKNVRNQSPGNFQMDVNFAGKKFDFERSLFRGMEAKGILFDVQQVQGNRFLLFKSGTANPYNDVNIY